VAVAKTGAMFKSLTFDGYSSRNYGVYITGEAVYNAPERAVEMISIPNRNGAFALDEGHFENIEVTYPAGVFADNEADFADAISDFRNLLCSRKGYCTLTDEYHPDEYREAVYKNGLEVTPSQLRAGEFTITFECKPQRFLNSGSTETTVTSGSTITNPTLFESNPLLKIWGYGDLNVNGYDITLNNETLGNVKLWNDETLKTKTFPLTTSTSFDADLLNPGDTFTASGDLTYKLNHPDDADWFSFVFSTSTLYTETHWLNFYRHLFVNIIYNPFTFVFGTSKTYSFNSTVTIKNGNNTTVASITITHQIVYDGSNTITWSVSYSDSGTYPPTSEQIEEWSRKEGWGDSSISALGNPTYIDCDIGESYFISGGKVVSLDNLIILGADLPVLGPGSNTITYDNTVTLFKIVPRWWKI
jgi:phage-related protein